jgi:hypothetical protein
MTRPKYELRKQHKSRHHCFYQISLFFKEQRSEGQLEVVEIKKKRRHTNDVARPISKQKKEALLGSAHLLTKDRLGFMDP